MLRYVKADEASKFYNTSLSNLRKMARDGKIPVKKTDGGHYRYLLSSPEDFQLKRIIYCRVSSKKQECDLNRQITFLQKKYPTYEIISDIGSGINFSRKGFKQILNLLFQRQIEEVIVAHQDRFSRFGFEFFQWMFNYFGTKLVSDDNESLKEDVLGDIMEIFTIFTARYYGKRKYISKIEKMD